MMIQEALNTAVDGGYHIYGTDGMDTYYEGANSNYSVWTRKDNESSFMVLTQETFLDAKFWQALGRVLGWSEACDLVITCAHGTKSVTKVAAPTGCISGIVLSRPWRTGIPQKPSLHVCPPHHHRGSSAHDSNPCRLSVLPPPRQTQADKTTTRALCLVSVKERVRY